MGVLQFALNRLARRVENRNQLAAAYTYRPLKKRNYPAERASPSPRYPNEQGHAKYRRRMSTWKVDYFDDENEFWGSRVLRKEFRRKFRIPREMFDDFVQTTRALGSWRDENDRSKRGARPLSLQCKIASALRIVSLGAGEDVAEEGSGVTAETMGPFIHKWIAFFNAQHKDEWLKPIDTDEEIARCEHTFAKMGMPGALTYMDVVQVAYPACPAALLTLYKGKEKEPTIGYQIHTDPWGMIRNIPRGAPGAKNDKTNVRADPFVTKMKNDPKFTEYEFEVYADENGSKEKVKGLYSTCDNGYHKWLCTIASMKTPTTPDEKLYSCIQESRRKNVECQFGILKKRGKILKSGLPYKSVAQCDNIVTFLCILHNMLKVCDGLHDIGNLETDWERVKITGIENLSRNLGSDLTEEDQDVDSEFDLKRLKLMRHMRIAHARGEVWKTKEAETCRPNHTVV